MSEPIIGDTDPHYPAVPLRVRALQVLLQKEGHREEGRNQGEIVKWATLWMGIRQERWQELYDKGALLWCACAAGKAYHEALAQLRREQPRALPGLEIRPHWSSEVSRDRSPGGDPGGLYERHLAAGWWWPWEPAAGEPPPEAGDLIFFFQAAGTLRPDHVGLVLEVRQQEIITLEGNAGNAVRRRTYPLHSPKIQGFSRVGGKPC